MTCKVKLASERSDVELTEIEWLFNESGSASLLLREVILRIADSSSENENSREMKSKFKDIVQINIKSVHTIIKNSEEKQHYYLQLSI